MEKINPILLIRREMSKRHMTAVDLAKKLNLHPSTVKVMLHSDTIQVQRLLEISEILQYNFLLEIASTLSYSEPKIESVATVENSSSAQDDHIKELEMEVKILRQTLKEIVGKG
ncbi:helix-turn-helix domain-containing protein [Parabacteroides sp. FAFU027]|uniref:helix-turn-helix domain-containing protein n=1 Tax=Parabacteroides sp. FAFU027 TaxID=2922715 RepID=UPI001FAF2BFE|nr:hypothetical protein [Parabacteroides sp. FAFU027]